VWIVELCSQRGAQLGRLGSGFFFVSPTGAIRYDHGLFGNIKYLDAAVRVVFYGDVTWRARIVGGCIRWKRLQTCKD
jgi:hypothetical protein